MTRNVCPDDPTRTGIPKRGWRAASRSKTSRTATARSASVSEVARISVIHPSRCFPKSYVPLLSAHIFCAEYWDEHRAACGQRPLSPPRTGQRIVQSDDGQCIIRLRANVGMPQSLPSAMLSFDSMIHGDDIGLSLSPSLLGQSDVACTGV
jgi:hypothetical protein